MLLPSAAAAQIGEQITRYRVSLDVQPDGDLVVVEQIDYDFAANDRHGIFRTIPYRYHYDDRYDRVMPIDEIRVSSPTGAPAGVDVSRESGTVTIRIGDPDRTISGRHRYVIEYRVRGALTPFEAHDELYWNAVGTEWSVPIHDVDVTVSGPGRIGRIACFRGPDQSTLPCASATRDGRQADFSDRGLFPFEGVTVAVGMRKGVIEPPPELILDERWSFGRAFTSDPSHLGVALAIGLLGVMGVVWMAWRRGRDREVRGSLVDVTFGTADGTDQPVRFGSRLEAPVEYTPPDGLRPGQVGTLVDEVAQPVDVSATIVDLAVRGHLRIEEVQHPGLFRKGDWRLVRLERADEDLLAYERRLLDALFRDDPQEVQLSDLRNEFAARLQSVQSSLYDDVVARGWFVRRPDRVRTFWYAIGIAGLVLGTGLAVVLAAFTRYGWVGVALVVVALVLLASAKRMPRRTPAGRAALRRVIGFRRFILESDEPERARFAERKNLFSEYLPYAIVFGAVDRWADAFGDLADQPSEVSWYRGTTPLVYHDLGRSIDDFNVVTAGTLTSTPAGSGGSGFSGGSSGGGGGGGGGGSW